MRVTGAAVVLELAALGGRECQPLQRWNLFITTEELSMSRRRERRLTNSTGIWR